MERIGRMPKSFPLWHGVEQTSPAIRKATVEQFPYLIAFEQRPRRRSCARHRSRKTSTDVLARSCGLRKRISTAIANDRQGRAVHNGGIGSHHKALWSIRETIASRFPRLSARDDCLLWSRRSPRHEVAVGIVRAEGREPDALQRWLSEDLDVRSDAAIAKEIAVHRVAWGLVSRSRRSHPRLSS